jgi:hypothetical protein
LIILSKFPIDLEIFRAGEETLSMAWRCTDLHKWFEDASSGFFGDAGSSNLVRAQVDYYWVLLLVTINRTPF